MTTEIPRNKKICKIVVGSRLYGTQTERSDHDYHGVFLPSREDVLGLKPYPGEINESVKISIGPRNSSEDVDCKYFSLAKFMNLAAEGQPGQLELLFAKSEHHAVPPTEEWREILSQRPLFLSRHAIVPFIRFAEAQARKATLKGENLELIHRLLAWGQGLNPAQLRMTIRETLSTDNQIAAVTLTPFRNDDDAELISVAGRSFDLGTNVRSFLKSLALLESKFGSRSRQAASTGVDWKCVHHAFRLLYEAEDLLTEAMIHFPFHGERLRFLMELKQGQLPSFAWNQALLEGIARIEAMASRSSLPGHCDLTKIESLHRNILMQALGFA